MSKISWQQQGFRMLCGQNYGHRLMPRGVSFKRLWSTELWIQIFLSKKFASLLISYHIFWMEHKIQHSVEHRIYSKYSHIKTCTRTLNLFWYSIGFQKLNNNDMYVFFTICNPVWAQVDEIFLHIREGPVVITYLISKLTLRLTAPSHDRHGIDLVLSDYIVFIIRKFDVCAVVFVIIV